MKQILLSGILLLATSLTAVADTIAINSSMVDSMASYAGRTMVGRVGVGPNRGGVCSLMVKSWQKDVYGLRFNVTFGMHKPVDKKWTTIRAEDFSMQDYSGNFFGSKPTVDKHGVQKKITASLFMDDKTSTYKLILHENKLVSDGSVGRYIVCESMVVR